MEGERGDQDKWTLLERREPWSSYSFPRVGREGDEGEVGSGRGSPSRFRMRARKSWSSAVAKCIEQEHSVTDHYCVDCCSSFASFHFFLFIPFPCQASSPTRSSPSPDPPDIARYREEQRRKSQRIFGILCGILCTRGTCTLGHQDHLEMGEGS